MTPETEQLYKNEIEALKAEIQRLKNQQTKAIKREKYGLNWIDVPEEFDERSKNSIPILVEDKSKAIKNDDGKPTHILIEGDNYHALTCLNYTHAGKIDVIYIDPPYNTGSDGFTYKDARFLTEFPNGKTVPKDDPLRHSTWLSFMSKRLKLAKNLLSDKGVIFISIDDNEQANLKLLCDEIFGEKNFVGCLPRVTKKAGKDHTEDISKNNDYVLIYKSKKNNFKGIEASDIEYSNVDEFFDERGGYKLNQTLDYDSLWYNPAMDFELTYNNESFYPGGSKEKSDERHSGIHKQKDWVWRWSKDKFDFGLKNGFVVIKQGKDRKRIYTKTYSRASISNTRPYKIEYSNRVTHLSSLRLTENEFSNDNAKKEITKIDLEQFDFPKPTSLIKQLLEITKYSSTILDFFAGSGTTMHATMKLNAEDGGRRQCILVQQPENDSNICESVTYERNRRVIQGYTNAKGEEIAGLGNSLKYYKTDFIGGNNPTKATDEDKITLAQKAGCLISLVENTLEEIETNKFYQIFSNADSSQFTGIYFNGDTEKLPDFVNAVESKNKPITVYIFSWGNPDVFENEFNDLSNITIKSIPEPILEIYTSLMKIGE